MTSSFPSFACLYARYRDLFWRKPTYISRSVTPIMEFAPFTTIRSLIILSPSFECSTRKQLSLFSLFDISIIVRRQSSRVISFVGMTRSKSLIVPVSYTHLRAHETRHDLVCRL